MSQAVLDIIESVNRLESDERDELYQLMLGPPDGEFEDLTEEEFIAELDRRSTEMRADPSVGEPMETVMARMWALAR